MTCGCDCSAGAHTLGRAFPKRSGFGKDSTKYTKDGPGTKDGTKGGSSWTPEWLKFDNSYFKHAKEQYDSDLLVLETDDVLFKDDGFRCDSKSSSSLQEPDHRCSTWGDLRFSVIRRPQLANDMHDIMIKLSVCKDCGPEASFCDR